MRLLGYGEDALSFWALTVRMSEFLRNLNDPSESAKVVLFFRPSFGRVGSTPVEPGGTADSSQFGEFDAVIGTPLGIYLIEAKWSKSPEVDRGTIILRSEQIRRHQLFREYLTAWRHHKAVDWNMFCAAQGGFLKVGDIRYPTAPVGSQLACNLVRVLGELNVCGESVLDVNGTSIGRNF